LLFNIFIEVLFYLYVNILIIIFVDKLLLLMYDVFVINKRSGVIQMKLLAMSIVSNSEMIKNYKTCREKAESFGKVFILKNNQPDAVLFSIAEYERLSVLIEYMESLDGNDIAKVIESLPKEGNRKIYSIDNLRNKIKDTEEKDTKVLAMDFSFN